MIDITKYPKSKVKLLGFTKGVLEKFQKEMLEKIKLEEGEIVPPIDDKITEDTAIYLLKNNIRALYNFFDMEGIYLIIDLYNGWVYKIPKEPFKPEISFTSISYKSREEAEVEGFKKAFDIMEGSL